MTSISFAVLYFLLGNIFCLVSCFFLGWLITTGRIKRTSNISATLEQHEVEELSSLVIERMKQIELEAAAKKVTNK